MINILGFGSGVGRFSSIIPSEILANLYSFDYSDADLTIQKNNEYVEMGSF